MSKLRIAFMGSPDFAVPTLEALLALAEEVEVVVVVTQPDRPAGRGQKLQPPPVKLVAERAGVPVWQPTSVRKPPFLDDFSALQLDLAVVVAYGRILPEAVLKVPRHGCWNVHASLLPKYRGAAPIQWAVIRGERETGATLMQMDVGLDTGPMLGKATLPIPVDMTAGQLFAALAPLGPQLVRQGLRELRAGTLVPVEQDHTQATLAPMLDKDTGRVDFTQPAEAVRDLVRGCDPWPTGTTLLDGEVLKLFGAAVAEGHGTPGTVLAAGNQGLVVACGEGAVRFSEVQLAGKKRLPVSAVVLGRPIPVGTKLGQ